MEYFMMNPETLPSYDPVDDPAYMSKEMLNYFKDNLMRMDQELLRKEGSISLSLIDAPNREPDNVDQGANEELRSENFAFLEHKDQLRHEVESALQRIDEGTYGYCEETGEPIGVKRLLIVPYARYCLQVQNHKEEERKRLTRGW
jgi:DnaK suppressor protein